VTGLAAHMDYLYVASTSQDRAYRYSIPGLYGRANSTKFGRNTRTHDIARNSQGLIWVADENSEMPVRCCDSAGNTVAYISSSLISSATGLTIDDTGKLWVSNNDDGMLYGIELTN